MGLIDRFRKQSPAEAPAVNQAPRGDSGRAHVNGFLEYDELNPALIGKAGLRIFDEMYRTDGDVKQVIGLMANPVISGTWHVQPAGETKATEEQIIQAKIVEWVIFQGMSPNLKGHLTSAMPVLLRSGFAPFEAIWGTATCDLDGKKYTIPKALGLRLPRTINRWFEDQYEQLTGIEMFSFQKGDYVSIQSRNLVYYRIGAEGDNWEGVSMLRPAYKHWKLKDAIERIDAIAQEREAVGIPLCYPPLGATKDQLDAMENILSSIRANEQGYIIAPGPHAENVQNGSGGWRIDILGFDRTGSGRDPQPSLLYHTNKILASVIAEFLALGHGSGGSRSTAQVQVNPFHDSIEALATLMEETLQAQLIEPFCRYNFAGIQEFPKIKMSLVDATSLTELADFVAKLVMVGAIIPDQILENWMRDRAELPPPDPEAVTARGSAQADADARKEVVTGPAAPPNTGGPEVGGGGTPRARGGKQGFGAHAKPGQPHGMKPVPARDRPSNLDQLSLDYGTGAGDLGVLPGARKRWRDLHGYELDMDLDGIEDRLDQTPDRFAAALQDQVYRGAKAVDMAALHGRKAPRPIIERLRDELGSLYSYGRQTVFDEHARRTGQDLTSPMQLSAEDPMYCDALLDRAEVAGDDVMHRVAQARHHARLSKAPEYRQQQAAEQAGMAAAKAAGRSHGMAAFNLGREDGAYAIALSTDQPEVGVRYSAILDRGTCPECRAADDGVTRALDDPVRLANKPPNQHCASNASGENRCRCVEHFMVQGHEIPGLEVPHTLDAADVPDAPGDNNWIDKTGTGDLPKFIGDIAGDLITERGFTTGHAIATAVERCRVWAAGGDGVKPDTQAKAAAALAEWESKKAQTHGGG